MYEAHQGCWEGVADRVSGWVLQFYRSGFIPCCALHFQRAPKRTFVEHRRTFLASKTFNRLRYLSHSATTSLETLTTILSEYKATWFLKYKDRLRFVLLIYYISFNCYYIYICNIIISLIYMYKKILRNVWKLICNWKKKKKIVINTIFHSINE